MSTTNEHVGAEGKFWPSEHGAPANGKDWEQSAEAVEADVKSAFREASDRSERESEIHDDDIEPLAHGFGSLKDGLAYAKGMTEYYRANPLEAREKHYRDYASRPPRPMPAREAPAQPPADLEPRALHEWHLENDVREALRSAPREQALRREREDAKELLAQAAAELGTTPGKLLEQASAVHQAMEVNPQHVSEKVARYFGKPVNEAHANEIVQAHVEQQETQRIAGVIDTVTQSGSCPGIELQEVRTAMAQVIKDPNFQFSGDHMMDLFNAYNTVAAEVQAYRQRQQQHEAAEGARRASRSIGGSSGSSVSEPSYSDGSIESDVRAAMYSSRA